MERNTSFEKWVRLSAKNEVEINKGEQEAEQEEEAFSLCNLPINEDEDNQSRKEALQEATKSQDDFDFCSLLKESEMVAADEVFFQGQILPLRHSVSSEGGLAASRSHSHDTSRCISRSESMERSNSSGFTSGSSRSSSIRSHQSSTTSSGSSSAYNTPIHKRRVRNHFHSHPSPRPQIKFSNLRNKNLSNSNQKSNMWSLFRLGLLAPPEIALENLKHRSNNINNNKAFGSRNSTSSFSVSTGANIKASKKKKQGIFDRNGAIFGGCKCSVDAVETVPSPVVTIRTSVKADEAYSHDQEVDQVAVKGTTKQQQEGKQALSRHRTFEWLKQLSLEGQNATDNEA